MSKTAKRTKKKFFMRNIKAIVAVGLILLILPLIFLLKDKAITLFSHAEVIPANIVVDASQSQAALKRPWQGISQGGETESGGALVSLAPVIPQIRALKPDFIRIDHVLERPYEQRVREIVQTGATPFISLSYFPRDVATSDTGAVVNWQAWKSHVRDLIENVSGKDRMNIANVYYEVWNEPDGEGFGGFNIGTGKDYFILYKNTVEAALGARNVNSFKIGGPSLADLRRCTSGAILSGIINKCDKYWLDQFLNLVASNKSRLDFISWHRYSTKISDFNEDVNFINEQYIKYDTLPPAEKIITEWGSNPARNPIHSTVYDAAHLVSSAKAFLGHVSMSTKFEIRDGPASTNDGWGILTHSGKTKPAYNALQLLNKLRSERILLSGEGSFITGIASRDASGVTVILSNFDPRQSNIESPQVLIKGLKPGKYKFSKLTINAPACPDKSNEIVVSNGTFKPTDIPRCSGSNYQVMPVNSVVLYDLQLVGL